MHNVSSFEERKLLDQYKNRICKENGILNNFLGSLKKIGITLIEVPYWWDRKYESLASTIYSQRPDLFTFPPEGSPIPVSPPTAPQSPKINESNPIFLTHFSFFQDPTKKILMTSTMWDSSTMNPIGWLMTEKYDGMRLYWNGAEFFTRQGTKVRAPEFITKQMPKIALDGELW
jgi:ATP-dependent DNA ligase